MVCEDSAGTRPVVREVGPVERDYIQDVQPLANCHQRRICKIHGVILGDQRPHALNISGIEIRDR